jgi:hypothetical protein
MSKKNCIPPKFRGFSINYLRIKTPFIAQSRNKLMSIWLLPLPSKAAPRPLPHVWNKEGNIWAGNRIIWGLGSKKMGVRNRFIHWIVTFWLICSSFLLHVQPFHSNKS